jgi:VWFA-related protein
MNAIFGRFGFALVVGLVASASYAQEAVRITLRPQGLVRGTLPLPVTVAPDVVRTELWINSLKWAEQSGRSMVFQVPVGYYIRPMRFRVLGYDSAGKIVGQDEVVVNDPRPPFRVKLIGRERENLTELSAVVTAPERMTVAGVEFLHGETSVGTVARPPYTVSFPATAETSSYARVVARAASGEEANDVFFYGSTPNEAIDVVLQRVPVSIPGKKGAQLSPAALELIENGNERPIEGVIRAVDQPLNAILLLDSSESMLEELPVLKGAARQFARRLIQDNGSVAIVGFAQGTFWLTPFTRNVAAIDAAVERLKPRGQTHLYDSVIEMLFELQKRDGRRALVVLSDGANQGGEFTLDHLVHYAKHSGVPVYPVIKNTTLAKFRMLGVGKLQERKLKAVARDSGATYFVIDKPQQLGAVYQQIADELRNQYLVLFYPDTTNRDQWHSMRITARDGTGLRAPKGFFP